MQIESPKLYSGARMDFKNLCHMFKSVYILYTNTYPRGLFDEFRFIALKEILRLRFDRLAFLHIIVFCLMISKTAVAHSAGNINYRKQLVASLRNRTG
jgi:hypothetical protein